MGKIIGIDFIKDTFQLANENSNLFYNVRFIEGDIKYLPFKNRCFDLTFCLNVLHHIHSIDLSQVLTELCRVTDKYLIVEIRFLIKGKVATVDNLRQNFGLPAEALATVDVLRER